MRRVLFVLALTFAGLLTLKANPVDLSLAQAAASKFAATSNERSASAQLVYSEANGAYYVFNTGEQSFVIIAGDDAYRPVIGYSNESAFDADNIPPALVDYLHGIAERILSLRTRGNAVAEPMVAAEWESVLEHGRLISRFGGRGVDFLLQTKWDQNYPYNCLCPEDPDGPQGHTYVGCLATAMSQLMRFWAMPEHGIGSHCYYHEDYGQICADFAATTYDWEHMPNELDNNSSMEEKLAVGTLCFHCGVIIDMGYGPDGSGGASSPIPGAMHTYFDYSEANVQYRRNDFETEEWKRMVREQFDMGWPMYYGGCDDGCHAFNCDGYDDFDMFHFNLGWGGSSNGWYIIDEAPYTNPADAMFNFVPSAIYNITPSAPTDFSVDVPVATELRTVLHWTNPSTSLDNSPLASIEEAVVMRDNQIIQVLTGMTPGQQVEFEDADVPFYDTYHYAVYVKANGRYGKHAYATEAMVGPSCQWKVTMSSSNYMGWNGGYVSVYNNVGHEVTRLTMTNTTPKIETPFLPLGNLSFGWTAPGSTGGTMSFTIKDSEQQTVYSFNGSFGELESGIFLSMNNACGGSQSCGTAENLVAVTEGDHVRLTWDAAQDEGYGYNIYRDGRLCRLIPAGTGTSYLDDRAPLGGHCYQIVVLCDGGEVETSSNESCASAGQYYPPRNLDYGLTQTFKIKLTWEPPVSMDGLTGYYLYRREGDGEYHRIKLLNADKTTYTDTQLSEEGDYYYRLYAYYRADDCTSAPANRKYYPNVFELHAYYSPTGTEETHTEVAVYPNPSNGTVWVEAQGLARVAAFNNLGQCVLDKEADGNSFEWADMAKGLYLMRIDTENGVFYTKLVVL